MQLAKDGYYISDDPKKVDITGLKHLLSTSYWAPNRSVDVIKTAVKNSVCFSVHKENQQIAFARVVTDYATFAYIADVIVDGEYRGQGIGKWLMDVVVNDERWRAKFLMLATDDAHKLYEKYGFTSNEKLMSTKV